MVKKLASDFFLKNISDQTLSLVVFYPKPMQNVPYTYYGGNVVELSGYKGRDKVSYDNDFGAKLD